MIEEIIESGITFKVDKEQLYYIEKTDLFQSFRKVKSCEFICLSPKKEIMFIEAKSSSPNPKNGKNDFKEYVKDISLKFRDSFLIFNALKSKRHLDKHMKEVPSAISSITIENAKYLFILVVNGYPKEWLSPIQSQLQLEMSYLRQTWNFQDTAIKVINEETARNIYHLI